MTGQTVPGRYGIAKSDAIPMIILAGQAYSDFYLLPKQYELIVLKRTIATPYAVATSLNFYVRYSDTDSQAILRIRNSGTSISIGITAQTEVHLILEIMGAPQFRLHLGGGVELFDDTWIAYGINPFIK